MPYSIETEDGITVDNIPDHIKPDAAELKQRVQQIRANRGGSATAAPAAPPPAPGLLDTALGAAKMVLSPASMFGDFGIAAAKNPQLAGKGFVMGATDPVHGGAQLLHNATPEPIRHGINSANNWVAQKTGLVAPVPEGGVDQMVRQREQAREADRAAAGDTGLDTSRLVGNVVSPVNLIPVGRAGAVAPWLAKVPWAERAITGAAGGAVQAALQPTSGKEDSFAGEKAGQVLAGMVGGGAINASAPGLVAQGAKLLRGKTAPMSPEQAQVAATNMLSSQGMRLEDVPPVIRAAVADEIKAALDAGGRVEPEAIMRLARARAVGLTGEAGLTAGQATREPIQLAQERNLSGVVLDGPQGPHNPMATRINNQNQALRQVFDNLGARNATDEFAAGQTLQGALRAADEPVKAGVDAAYTSARAMNAGRAAELDRAGFVNAANEALDQQQLGHYLEPEARKILNDIASGKAPFTVDTEVQLDSILSGAQRQYGKGSRQASAAGVVRDQLRATGLAQPAPPMRGAPAETPNPANVVDNGVTDVPYRETAAGLPRPASTAVASDPGFPQPSQPGAAVGPAAAIPIDEGAAARQAFAEARRAAGQRHATIRDTPALQAALDNEAPDAFVRKYVIGGNVQDLEAMRRVLENSPEALGQARAQFAEYLRRAAFGSANSSGDGAFAADRFLKTLDAVPPAKLRVFFTPDEIVQLRNAGQVASDLNSTPAGARYAVNNSGTGSAIFNLLAKLGDNSVLRKIPFARTFADQAGQIANERKINQALSGRLLAPSNLPPEQEAAIRALFARGIPGAGAAGGALVTQASE